MLRLFSALSLALWLAMPAAAQETTLHHGFGQTTLDPGGVTRIVSVGYHEQDFLYGLGLAPVGVHEWFGGQPYATWPWAESARQAVAATPEVQTIARGVHPTGPHEGRTAHPHHHRHHTAHLLRRTKCSADQ